MSGRLWLDDEGIIHGKEASDVAFELADAQEALAVIGRLAGGRRRVLVMDMTGLKSMSRDARAYFSSAEHTTVLLAVALVVRSHLSRAIGNLFLGLNKPAMPTRLFNDDEAALAWARTCMRSAGRD